ncbi:MAG TPA: chemotaxis protein CheW [Spirochaetia bacterium]|nr:chemotaxis protein CheW [Spirochaetia bacterium]
MQTMSLSDDGRSDVRQLISFTVGTEQYGLELLRVKEVIRARAPTWLPKAPSCVKGIINLRGDVIPIVDLRERFGLPQQEATAATRVIVVEVETTLVGMVVDSASQVVRIPVDQFSAPPPVMGDATRGYITSVGRRGEELVIMLDVDRILGADEKREIADSLSAVVREPALSGR